MKTSLNLFLALLTSGCALFFMSCQQEAKVNPTPTLTASATAQSNSSSITWMTLSELRDQENINIFEAPNSYIPLEERRSAFNYSTVYIYQHFSSGANMELYVFNTESDRISAEGYLALKTPYDGPCRNCGGWPCGWGNNCLNKPEEGDIKTLSINNTTIEINGWIALSN